MVMAERSGKFKPAHALNEPPYVVDPFEIVNVWLPRSHVGRAVSHPQVGYRMPSVRRGLARGDRIRSSMESSVIP
jgi:hypothetical protein